MERFISQSPVETFEIGFNLGKSVSTPSVICFFGELAAGKTTFIKGIVAGAAQLDPSQVQSPTFSFLHLYEGEKKVYHFDLYRLRDIDEFLSMGFDEYLESDGICCIEWSERIADYLPVNSVKVTLQHISEDKRLITII